MPRVRQLHTGSCSHCHALMKLSASNGTIHKHGPRDNPCPGSGKLPDSSDPKDVSSSFDSNTGLVDASQNNSQSVPIPVSQLGNILSHPVRRGPLIKRIPRSARQGCSTLLSNLIQKVNDDIENIVNQYISK